MGRWINFNFHNSAYMRVAEDTPTASLFVHMFSPFLTDEEFEHFDLTVTGEISPLKDAAYGEIHGQSDIRYSDEGVYIEASDAQILKNGNGYHLQGKRELLVMALPIIDHILVERSLGMIHALTVDYRGHGVSMPAWGGVGKTSAMAKLVKIDGVGFMGDDWAFLSGDGRLFGYAKPMTIKPYHKEIYPDLFKKRHKPLIPNPISKPFSRWTTMVHPLFTRYPRLAQVFRRWSPEHMILRPQQAFPHAKFSTEAPLALSIFVERYDGSAPALEERSQSWMVNKLISNFYAELTRHSKVVGVAMAASGLVSLEETFGQKADVLRAALGDKPNYLLQIPKAFSADRASDVIVEKIQMLLAD